MYTLSEPIRRKDFPADPNNKFGIAVVLIITSYYYTILLHHTIPSYCYDTCGSVKARRARQAPAGFALYVCPGARCLVFWFNIVVVELRP